MSLVLRRSGRWSSVSLLVAGLLICGTFLLVKAEVRNVEPDSGVTHKTSDGVYRSRSPVPSRPAASSAPARHISTPAATLEDTAHFPPVSTPTASWLFSASPVPEPTPDGTVRLAIIPVLMYHHVALPPAGADAVRRDLSVSPANFEAQLRYLVERGYEPITLSDLMIHLQAGLPLPARPVILTFDDGFKDQYTNAYPLLKRYGFVATFFIITGFVDERRSEYVSWADVELLHASGMEIGSHSYTHPSLSGKSTDYIVWQVLGSKEAIEARTHQPVRFFSYPSGQYDRRVVDVLHSAGYWGAVTVEPGSLQSSQHPFEFRRIRVRGRYNLEEFDHWFNYWLSHP